MNQHDQISLHLMNCDAGDKPCAKCSDLGIRPRLPAQIHIAVQAASRALLNEAQERAMHLEDTKTRPEPVPKVPWPLPEDGKGLYMQPYRRGWAVLHLVEGLPVVVNGSCVNSMFVNPPIPCTKEAPARPAHTVIQTGNDRPIIVTETLEQVADLLGLLSWFTNDD